MNAQADIDFVAPPASQSNPMQEVLDRVLFAADHMRCVEYERADRPCKVYWSDARGDHETEGRNLVEATEKAIAEHRSLKL